MDDVEVAVEVLQTKVDVVDLTPVWPEASAKGRCEISFLLVREARGISLPEIWRHVPNCGRMQSMSAVLWTDWDGTHWACMGTRSTATVLLCGKSRDTSSILATRCSVRAAQMRGNRSLASSRFRNPDQCTSSVPPACHPREFGPVVADTCP